MANIVGKTIADRYRIEESLGRGGMAEVYKAWDTQRAIYLAVKVLREDLARDRIFWRRFKREAETLQKLQHPNIVRFYGLERDNLLAFMLIDYIEGSTLQGEIFLLDGKPMDTEKTLQVIRGVSSGLYFAHSLGLVHCDLKPGNIMITKFGQVLLADFGIARLTDAATATMVGMGTPAYMAPEQVKGLAPVPQTDIYALGVVLFEMLTGGERPFTGEQSTTTGTISAKVRWEQVNLDPPSPRLYSPDISVELETVVLKCLAKKPAERYQTPLELLNALEQATGEKPAGVTPGLVPTDDSQTDSPRQITPVPERELSPNLSLEQTTFVDCPGCESKIPADSKYCKECGAKLTPKVLHTPESQKLTGANQKVLTLSDDIEIVFLLVPAGEFLMGEDKQKHTLNLSDYWIGKSPVTNRQYSVFIQESSHTAPQHWKDGKYTENNANHPVARISWFDAQAFCGWLAECSGELVHLPTEPEWEKAARGTDGRTYPWGEETPNVELCNFDNNVGEPSPVGIYSPQGDSPYGCLDMAGNVWEWTGSLDSIYPLTPDEIVDIINNPSKGSGVLRGSSWNYLGVTVRAPNRVECCRGVKDNAIGFRCALSNVTE